MDQNKTACLVAAAGRGLRFGREMPKSFYPLEGRTLLSRSIQSLRAWPGIGEFIVLVPSGWEDKAKETLAAEVPDIPLRVITGGETRQESVEIGLRAIKSSELVLVHDACRPFVSLSLIERVVAGAVKVGAAVPALQATETLGRLRDDSLESIIPRDRVVNIQTPQAFRVDTLRRAFQTTEEAVRRATDESTLVLAAGFPVKVVEGERWNIKITVKEDIDLISCFPSGCRGDLAGE
ncbi:MAG: 2-C-methyl-D-erythritol 4-phosphate cytidylyltransferase [Candidatus Krumholzibacteriota bacterium]|nr:2-C-methyl-D-erythritol 4-phosphate cytidylyltransferase [Candidatus Krumholzibacteriota bacterium]